MMARGFTLIEALIAFSILAVVLGVTASATSSGLTLTSRAGDATARVELARSILEAVGVETPLAPGEQSGRFANGDAWRLTLTRLDEGELEPGLYQADLTLFDDQRPALSLSVLKVGG